LGEMIRVLPGQVFALEKSSTVVIGDRGRRSKHRRRRLVPRPTMNTYPDEMIAMPLLTLGQAVAAKVRLIVWCRACEHGLSPTRWRWRKSTARQPPS
jgi:hypothetical protein